LFSRTRLRETLVPLYEALAGTGVVT
jgi:hypothetical protein